MDLSRGPLLATLAIALMLSACHGSTEDKAKFEAASRENTAAAYQDYLAAHPDGRFVKQAREAVESLNKAAFDKKAVEAANQCKNYFAEFRTSTDKAPSGAMLISVQIGVHDLTGELGYTNPELAEAINQLSIALTPVVEENRKLLEEVQKASHDEKNFMSSFKKVQAGALPHYIEYWVSHRDKIILAVDAFIAQADNLPQ